MHTQVMSLLINEGGADPNSPGETDFCPIMAAAMLDNTEGLRALIKVAGPRLDVNKPRRFNNATPLGIACYAGSKSSLELLLEAGADPNHTNDHGGNQFHDLACNPNVDASMLDLIGSVSEPDLMVARRRNKSWKWEGIDRVFEALVTFRVDRSNFAEVRPLRRRVIFRVLTFAFQHLSRPSLTAEGPRRSMRPA